MMVLLVLGMFAVTYVSRVVPFFAVRSDRLPPFVRRLLEAVPPAALGALLIPGVFDAVEASVPAGVLGACAAGLLSALTRRLAPSVLAGLLVTLIAVWLEVGIPG